MIKYSIDFCLVMEEREREREREIVTKRHNIQKLGTRQVDDGRGGRMRWRERERLTKRKEKKKQKKILKKRPFPV